MQNFLPLSRDIRNHWIYKDPAHKAVWLEMLLVARYHIESGTDTYDGVLYTLNRGEFIFGRKAWSERLGVGEQKIRTLIEKLTNEKMIEIVLKTKRFTIYRIVNYEKYNSSDNQWKDQGVEGFEDGGNHLNNQPISTGQPTENHQITTYKEGLNNDNKDNNIIPYLEIFNLYNQQQIIRHKVLDKKMKKIIQKALKNYSIDQIKTAIVRYGEMYRDARNDYAIKYCKYKWTLIDLFTRDKGISEFLDEGGKWIRYQEAAAKGNKVINPCENIES